MCVSLHSHACLVQCRAPKLYTTGSRKRAGSSGSSIGDLRDRAPARSWLCPCHPLTSSCIRATESSIVLWCFSTRTPSAPSSWSYTEITERNLSEGRTENGCLVRASYSKAINLQKRVSGQTLAVSQRRSTPIIVDSLRGPTASSPRGPWSRSLDRGLAAGRLSLEAPLPAHGRGSTSPSPSMDAPMISPKSGAERPAPRTQVHVGLPATGPASTDGGSGSTTFSSSSRREVPSNEQSKDRRHGPRSHRWGGHRDVCSRGHRYPLASSEEWRPSCPKPKTPGYLINMRSFGPSWAGAPMTSIVGMQNKLWSCGSR